MTTYLVFKCKHCKKKFKRSLSQSHSTLSGRTSDTYCSRKCVSAEKKTSVLVSCANCSLEFYKTPNQIKTTKNNFCSLSCSATYNNKNKRYGTRRSKAEKHLEMFLSSCYPDMNIVYNDKSTIGSELDFYFPDYRFAIELNGIFHYEPIYGQDKFEKIQDNDRQKVSVCRELGIELAIVNISHIKHLTDKRKTELEKVFTELLDKVSNRK